MTSISRTSIVFPLPTFFANIQRSDVGWAWRRHLSTLLYTVCPSCSCISSGGACLSHAKISRTTIDVQRDEQRVHVLPGRTMEDFLLPHFRPCERDCWWRVWRHDSMG